MAALLTTTVLPAVTQWVFESLMTGDSDSSNVSVDCLQMALNLNTTGSGSGTSLLPAYCQPTRPAGPPAMPVSDVITVLFYSLICVVGLVGNGLVIAVILVYASMKTATNVYLVNLSAADLMFLVGLPLIITTATLRGWVFGHVMCKVFYALTCANTFNGSLTLAILSGDRFLAVCFPVTSRGYRTPRVAVIVVAISWLITAVAIYPVARFAEVVERDPGSGMFSCTMNWPDGYVLFIVYTFVLGFFAPIALICIFYAFLVARLATVRRRASSHGPTGNGSRNGGGAGKSRASRSQRRVTFMVTVVVAVYIVCWLPYWAFQLFIVLSGITALPFPWFADLFKALTALSYANSMINPLLYAFTNEQFRKSFLRAFHCDVRDTPSPGASVCMRAGSGGVGGNVRRPSRAPRDYDDQSACPRRSSVLTSVVGSHSTEVSMQRLSASGTDYSPLLQSGNGGHSQHLSVATF
jgi:hypothetical protein